jgi:hypothetical protein
MKHFSTTEWADFSRGTVDNARKEAMQAHLDGGCARCAEMARTWERVRQIARRERSYGPPESAIRTAKGLLPVHSGRGRTSLVRLMFDSLQSPAMAGVRSTTTDARQMLYGIGAYRVDLRMEPQMDSDKVALVGQVLDSADPVKGGVQATVVLLRGRKVLAESQTNALGEFHLECSLEGNLQLQLTLPRDLGVRIPLVIPTEPATIETIDSANGKQISRKRISKYGSTRKGS